MCLIINPIEHENLKPRIAKQDIFGYKVLLYKCSKKKFYTPYTLTPVDITAEFKCKRFQNTPETIQGVYTLHYIDRAIHIYSALEPARYIAQKMICDISNTTSTYVFACIYRVTIPKGNKYWIGAYKQMCTKSILFKDIVATFCNRAINTGKNLKSLQRECINLLKDGVNEDILRNFFYSIDVDKIIREYTEAELGILEPTY